MPGPGPFLLFTMSDGVAVVIPPVVTPPVEVDAGGGGRGPGRMVGAQRTVHASGPIRVRLAVRIGVRGELVPAVIYEAFRAPVRMVVVLPVVAGSLEMQGSLVEVVLAVQVAVQGEVEFIEDEMIAKMLLEEWSENLSLVNGAR